MPQRPPRSADGLRRWVRARSPQPFDDADVVPRPADRDWVYGPGQYPPALLDRLVADGFAANRHVHYPRNHAGPAERVDFRAVSAGAGVVRVLVSGRADVAGDGVRVRVTDGGLELAIDEAGAVVEVAVTGGPGAVPALGAPRGAVLGDWTASVGGGPWTAADVRPGGERPPHLDPPGTVDVVARPGPAGLLDVGAPVLGRPFLPAGGAKPGITSGESEAEAFADPAVLETRHDVASLPDGGWTTRHPLGFRYLRVAADAAPQPVAVRAEVAPAARPGAFACSDDRLTRIWAAAQYTLRLCSQGLMIDGIKRDRMPWAGDQALSTLANAFALGDARTVADGLVALGRPQHGYVNGIADYSLWWVVDADLYVRYFGDTAFAEREAEHVEAFVADLARHADDDGVFRPAEQPGGFVDSGPGSVFLDWGLALEQGRDPVALQMLWWWALGSAARLLDRAAHAGAGRWRGLAETLGATLRARGWLAGPGRWADYLGADAASASTAPYANFLAVVAGLHPDGVPPGVAASIAGGTAGTPFMTAFRLRARLAAGEHAAVLDEIRHTWGAMLDAGPGTFWEEAATGEDDLAMYGRPFGRSRCHAWSAGPAAILPEAILGVRPLADGWTRFAVDPRLDELDWAAAVVPTPSGDVVVHAAAGRVTVRVPAGTALVRGERVDRGPAVVEWSTAEAVSGWPAGVGAHGTP
ncbi:MULTISPECIES: alpha-L-rhamnosidase-related protein [unclassified Agromyces]|uniref:alpha-L-rhamnosidase-related protein n=1 Tax=unclassified Agromyces TaxID=2639701 RepID=UPI00301569A3